MTDVARRPLRIVLAEDSVLLREGLVRLFDEAGFETVGAYGDADALLAALDGDTPDLAVLDVRMPRVDGLGVLAAIRERRLPTRVLLLAAAIEPTQAVEALRLGARGLVLKEMAPELVVDVAASVWG